MDFGAQGCLEHLFLHSNCFSLCKLCPRGPNPEQKLQKAILPCSALAVLGIDVQTDACNRTISIDLARFLAARKVEKRRAVPIGQRKDALSPSDCGLQRFDMLYRERRFVSVMGDAVAHPP